MSEDLVAVLDTRALAVVLCLNSVMQVRHLRAGVLLTSCTLWADATSTGFCTLILLAAQGGGHVTSIIKIDFTLPFFLH